MKFLAHILCIIIYFLIKRYHVVTNMNICSYKNHNQEENLNIFMKPRIGTFSNFNNKLLFL